MDFEITAGDMRGLNALEKWAILECLFLAVAIDRQLTEEERVVFDKEMDKIPWGLEEPILRDMIAATRLRVKLTTRPEDWQEWIREIARRVPTAVREKLLGKMSFVAAADAVDRRERGLINSFALAFGIPNERLTEIGAAIRAKIDAS